MAVREILLPWESQPTETVQPDYTVAQWGTLVLASRWQNELVNQVPVTQFNATYLMRATNLSIGQVITTTSNSAVAALNWLPSSDMGAIIGSSAFWYGIITSATTNSSQTGIFGRYTTTSGGAGYAGQFFIRISTTGEIQLDVNAGSGIVTYSSGLFVNYNSPLTILIKFTVSGVDIITSVGRTTISISGMVNSVGIYTYDRLAHIGSDRWNYTGHPYQHTAVAGWARNFISENCIINPFSVIEPRKLHINSVTTSSLPTLSLSTFVTGSLRSYGFIPKITTS